MPLPKSVSVPAAALSLLAACGTPEYRAERAHCEAEWMLKIPPVHREEVVTKYRTEKRPTGETNCEKKGDTMLCQPAMENVSVPYTAVETVDIRKPQRDPQIESCAARACSAKYGNTKCET